MSGTLDTSNSILEKDTVLHFKRRLANRDQMFCLIDKDCIQQDKGITQHTLPPSVLTRGLWGHKNSTSSVAPNSRVQRYHLAVACDKHRASATEGSVHGRDSSLARPTNHLVQTGLCFCPGCSPQTGLLTLSYSLSFDVKCYFVVGCLIRNIYILIKYTIVYSLQY